jgi:protein gp37
MPTNIPYVDEVWNPVVGCTKCSPGCDNCWAEVMANRLAYIEHPKLEAGFGGKYNCVIGLDSKWNGYIYCDEKALKIPLHWRKPRKILTCSMGDWMHPKVPYGFIDRMRQIMKQCPQHTFMTLTKRIDRLYEYCEVKGRGTWPDNIWPGATICNQKEADEKIPILLSIPAAHRFISVEPMLGPVDLEYVKDYSKPNTFGIYDRIYSLSGETSILGHKITCEKLNQVIIGNESGPNRRPCKREWIQDLVNQCKAAGVKYMVKQMAKNKDGTGKVIHDLEWIKSQLGD